MLLHYIGKLKSSNLLQITKKRNLKNKNRPSTFDKIERFLSYRRMDIGTVTIVAQSVQHLPEQVLEEAPRHSSVASLHG